MLGGVTVLAFGLGSIARAVEFDDTFNPLVVNGNNDRMLGYYVRFVREADEALMSSNSIENCRRVAREWVAATRAGTLKQIYQGYHGQSLLEGPRGQMFRSCFDVSNRLAPAMSKVKGGNVTAQDLDDSILAMEMVDTVRYAHQEVLFAATTYMARPVRILKDNEHKLTEDQKARIAYVQNEESRRTRLESMLAVQRLLRKQYELRYGAEAVSTDELITVGAIQERSVKTSASHFYGFDKERGILHSARTSH